VADQDIDILRKLLDADKAASARWHAVRATMCERVLDGEAALAELLGDIRHLRLGWIVRTDAVLGFDGAAWRTRNGELIASPPWQRLLQAELAFTRNRGVRLTLLRDRKWHCQEVIEGDGETFLAKRVDHQGEWCGQQGYRGVSTLRFRVYWECRPITGGQNRPVCYQPVASRWMTGEEQD
jgi:hypothetical protein